jgi:t-SNARE complex subunit (syntaxin)
MDDFNYYNTSLLKRLERLENLTQSLLNSPPESSNKLLNECESEIKRIETDLEACENAIQQLEKGPNKSSAEKTFMSNQERFTKCKTEIQFKKSNKPQGLFGNIEEEKPKKLHELSAQQVVERGDNLYNEAESRLVNALGITEQSKQVVGGIEVELKQQEEQMDRIHDKTQDLRSNLKRANKIMDLIYRRYLTDKCIMVLIILIIIILIVIIAFGAVKAGKLSFATDSIS